MGCLNLSYAVDIPSKEDLRGSARKHFKKQEKILKNKGYRFGDQQLGETIRNKIRTREICEDYNIDTGVKAGLFGLKIRLKSSLGISEKSVFNYDYVLANNRSELANLPPKCRDNFLKAYKNHKAENDQERDSYCSERACELVEEANNMYIENIDALEASFTEEDRIVIETIECAPTGRSREATDEVENLAAIVKDVRDCTPLNIGESRVTSETDRLNDYVEQKYAITRTGDNQYKVDLNINFVPGNFGEKGSGPQKKTAMLKRVRHCISEFNKVAKDSLGRELQFNILTPEETLKLPKNLRPPQVDIAIRPADSGRQNSRAYNENIGCETVSHEMLHLLGLHDEYHEGHIGTYTHKETGKTIGYYKADGSYNEEGMKLVEKNRDDYEVELAYQCRNVPTKNTIMKDIHSFYPTVISSPSVCSCEGLSGSFLSTCLDILSQDESSMTHYYKLSSSRFEFIENMREYCTGGEVLPTIKLDSFSDIQKYQLVGDINETDLSLEFTKFQASYGDFGKVSLYPSRRSCNCEAGDSKCLDVIKKIKSMGRSTDAVPTFSCPFPAKEVEISEKEITNPQTQRLFKRSGLKNAPAMLENAHVEKILFPGCDSRGGKYLQCLNGAYSKEGTDCGTAPAFCSDDSWLSDI